MNEQRLKEIEADFDTCSCRVCKELAAEVRRLRAAIHDHRIIWALRGFCNSADDLQLYAALDKELR